MAGFDSPLGRDLPGFTGRADWKDKKMKVNYTLGVELEVIGVRPDSASEALRSGGIASVAPGYTHDVIDTWKAVPDGSVSGRGGSAEIVSPILTRETFAPIVFDVVRCLRRVRAGVNRSAGLHVHIGVGDWSNDKRANFAENWHVLADAIDSMVAPSRRLNGSHSRWCARRSEVSSRDLVRRMRAGEEFTNGSRDAGLSRGENAASLNVASFARYGTFEIRLHQGSLNAGKIGAWSEFLCALADYSGEAGILSGTYAGAEGATSLVLHLALGGWLDSTVADYLIARIGDMDEREAV